MKNKKFLALSLFFLSAAMSNVLGQNVRPGCANNSGPGPGGPSSCPTAQGGSNPFRAFGGNLNREVIDLEVFGGVGQHQLAFKRYYNSRLDLGSRGLGDGAAWVHQYRWNMDDAGTNNSTGNPLLSVDFPSGENYVYEKLTTNEWRTIYGVDSWIEQTTSTNFILRNS
ncbi:MAG: hypothetical protein ACTHKU_07635, partial [Verrucomicrobiota bacterium]